MMVGMGGCVDMHDAASRTCTLLRLRRGPSQSSAEAALQERPELRSIVTPGAMRFWAPYFIVRCCFSTEVGASTSKCPADVGVAPIQNLLVVGSTPPLPLAGDKSCAFAATIVPLVGIRVVVAKCTRFISAAADG